jgi:hypothetical protein
MSFGFHPISSEAISALAEARTFAHVATGGIEYAGAAAVSKQKCFLATGGIEFDGAAGLSKAKAFLASGGIVFDGTAAVSESDVFPAAGGVIFGGSAVTAFAPAAQPVAPPVMGHGRGRELHQQTATVPIKRRQYGDAVDIVYRASGGIEYGGAARTAFMRIRNEHTAPVSAVVLEFSGRAKTRFVRNQQDAEFLLLLAA